jgi:hypothetical protein
MDTAENRDQRRFPKNDDGTVSFISIDPGVDGFEFVVGGTQKNPTGSWRLASDG